MRSKISRFKKIMLLALFSSLAFIVLLKFSLADQTQFISANSQKIYISETKYHTNLLWIDNPTFSGLAEPWYSSIEGDPTDVLASKSTNQANFEIIGDSREKQVLLNNENYINWQAFNKTELTIVPNLGYGVEEDGCYLGHDWNEDSGGQPYNTPRMHWKTIINMPVDMSDYIITSASFEAIINATVNRDVDTPGDTIARWPSSTLNQYVIYDYAQFYVEVSDLSINELNTYRIAFNQTRNLGHDDPEFYQMEGNIAVKDEQSLINAINSVLAIDQDHKNFTLVLGIFIYDEDNYSGNDRDQWNDLRFKSLNMTFSYVKKINQFTTISWNQNLKEINGTNVKLTDANLKFKYKVDQNWTFMSQNSQIRIYINDRKFEEFIPLIDYIYTPSFKDAKSEGYDLVSKILPYENFNLSIQVFLADNFGLDNNINISITDVYLYISYTETFPDPISENWLFVGLFIIATMAAITTVGYLIAYQLYLKYPIPVRKVRKYRKTLLDEKDPSVPIIERKRSIGRIFQKELDKTAKFLSGTPQQVKAPQNKPLGKPSIESKDVKSP